MSQDLQFKVSSGLKNIIGRELITDDFTAIFELVKNSFDAHATEVEIVFKDLNTANARIIIVDNGKGMDYDDLINKWLFVAYSAKRDGTEDLDYRSKIKNQMYYAGAKGIGRFSCDKLGSKLRLVTTKDSKNSKVEELIVDWEKFEQDSKEEFINVSVQYQSLNEYPSKYSSGTMLEISNLRSDSIWDIDKVSKLKRSLAKLINPFSDTNKRPFKIILSADEFIEHDNQEPDTFKKINGLVKNNLLEILKVKTTKIIATISSDGDTITYELSNNGVWLYKISEKNIEYNLLSDILIELYFLDRRAKLNFTKFMGIKSREYGSVFLYKNGIRIYPFGEPGEDSFALDKRQARRLGDYVGTSDLIGRIEITGKNEEFKETTSRGDGLIKNSSYEQLQEYFIDKVVVKLESFRKNIVRYGIDIDEFENNQHSKEKIIKLIADISNSDNIISIEFNQNLLELINETQEESSSAKSIIKSIETIAKESDNKQLFDQIKKVKNTLEDAIIIADLAEEEIRSKEKEIKESTSQNLFLKSLKSQDFIDLVSLMHHIGISSGIIGNYLKILTYKIEKNIEISNHELKETIAIVNLENQKILSISRFATKANFKMNAEDQKLDLIEFIAEYIENVARAYNNDIEIKLNNNSADTFLTIFKPIEMTIIIDNLINNSKKAKATLLEITLSLNDSNLIVAFRDNGVGIPPNIKNKIFDFGFTTTGGSGMGLTHIKEILLNNRGSIFLNTKSEKGTEFVVTFKK